MKKLLIILFTLLIALKVSAADVTIPSGVTVTTMQIPDANSTFTNNGTINRGGGSNISSQNNNVLIINNGVITNAGGVGGGTGIMIDSGGTSNSIVNNTGATITNVTSGIATNSGAIISSLTNEGSITGSSITDRSSDILLNFGSTLQTLNNAQGGNSSSAATTAVNLQVGNYGAGPLPLNYNIIIRSRTYYGQLAVTAPWGISAGATTNFGIYAGGVDGVAASTVTKGTYSSVLSGLTTSNVGATRSGTYSGLNWTLALQSGSSTVWDLIFSGASTADTQSSLNTQARRLRSAFNLTITSSNFANMNTYDCNLFDQNNMCISAGGRYTSVDNPSSNHSAAVVVLGYKVNSNIRIGGFLDQSVNHNTPTGVHLSNSNPMMGAFAVWNQNTNGLGYQVKLANAYQDKDVTTTRDVIGTSEAGTGKTNLNTQSYVGELSYAFNYQDSTLVRPYFALRYTHIKQDAYTEDTTSSVTAPLTYAKLSDRSTTALMGVKVNHVLNSKTNLTGSLGIEQDLDHKVDQLSASGVSGLTSENFNSNIKRTRPVASVGAYYAVAKNQRVSGEVYYQQLPFQSTGSATAYVNYMIGF